MIPTITAFEQSPDRGRGLARDMRVRWALEEVNQPYDVRLVSFREMKIRNTGRISEPLRLCSQGRSAPGIQTRFRRSIGGFHGRSTAELDGTPGELMFDHVKFGVTDYAASKAFFLKALEPLGVVVVSEGSPTYGIELCQPQRKVSLCLCETAEKPAHLHLAFAAENRGQVEAFYRAALEAGGKDNGAPGLRPHYHANYYAAFVIGPDGHNIEVVCHEPEA